jgi:diamine N-acetyltransferase
MQDLKLIRAGVQEIDTIAELAHLTWNQHYRDIIGQQQIDHMLLMMYSRESLQDQILNKNHFFYLITDHERNIGFLSLEERGSKEWFLNKFYLDQKVAALGKGTAAFGLLKQLIEPVKISLTVNRKNYKSINFYFKMGFKIEKLTTIDIGNGFEMDDFVMVWKKSQSPEK